MSFVIYNPIKHRRYETPKRHASWSEQRIAKSVRTKAIKAGDITEDYQVMTWEEMDAADPMIEVTSAFDGKTKCWIKASSKGSCTDPSMEGHWQS